MENDYSIRVLDNGVTISQGPEIMHQCQYCETWFKPGRRFSQKYCGESCRVLACRKRHLTPLNGVDGASLRKRDKTTNSALKNAIVDSFKAINDRLYELEQENKELKEKMGEIKHAVQVGTEEIKSKQNWTIGIATIMPLIAPKIIEKISALFSNNKITDYNQLEAKLDPIIAHLPKDIQFQIKTSAFNSYNGSNAPQEPEPTK